ncbi:MAG: EI24 domain-containing protein, partial [Synechococcus sp.]|nr:EI24 domain-containing protein [Synechococcus sp.]
ITKHPKLWQYLAIPIGVNVVVGSLLYTLTLRWAWRMAITGYQWISGSLISLIDQLPSWLQWLDYGANFLGFLLGVIFISIMFIGVGLVLVQFGVVLGAPWYGQLSEQIEKLRTGRFEMVEVGIFRDIGRAILFELKKLLLVLTISPLLFGINFLPGVGSVLSYLGGMGLTLTILCLDFFDATLERRRLPFRGKLRQVYRDFPGSLGFSLICLPLVSLPLLNLITIPFCVASGTLFVCDRLLPKLNHEVNEEIAER